MTSRKRKNFLKFLSKSDSNRKTGSSSDSSARSLGIKSRMRRQHLLETLESRQLLAGPQLIGVQPNEGDLIVDGTSRDVAPRVLTFNFDEAQVIDPATTSGIRITRAGNDGTLGTTDDVQIVPGLVTLGDTRSNEVVVRFAETLPDDNYRIEVFAFDDPARGITAVRNVDGEVFIPSNGSGRTETIDFSLDLGALVESIVPQPVVRQADGTLAQYRNEIDVYFNNDPLFVEDSAATGSLVIGAQTIQVTADLSDRTFDDVQIRFVSDNTVTTPVSTYDSASRIITVRHRSGSTFNSIVSSIDSLNGFNSTLSGDGAAAFTPPAASSSPFVIRGVPTARSAENPRFYQLLLTQETVSTRDDVFHTPQRVIYDATTNVARLIFASDIDVLFGTATRGGTYRLRVGNAADQADFTVVPQPAPFAAGAAGDTVLTSADVGTFGNTSTTTSFLINEAIEPVSFGIQLPGSTDDPGRRSIPDGVGGGLSQTLNERFGADVTDGITTIPYNFKSIFAGGGSTGQSPQNNNIDEIQKARVREAVSLWANYVGVQFRETESDGITFAVGNTAALRPLNGNPAQTVPAINASLRIDPTFVDSAIVFSNQQAYDLNYGEDFFRKTMAGIGFLLGLEQGSDLTEQSLMSLSSVFLNESIDVEQFLQPLDSFLPLNTIDNLLNNAAITGQTIDDAPVNALTGFEPSFPGNLDVLHGNFLYRLDGNEVDLYKFTVDVGTGIRTGMLTAETFAQRLPDASLLDTTLLLFKDQLASASSSFEQGAALNVEFSAVAQGALGNNVQINFVRTDRAAGDAAVRIIRPTLSDGTPSPNAITVDVPRRSLNVASVTIGSIISAINADPFARTIVSARLTAGALTTDVIGAQLDNPIILTGGGLTQLNRNDDYSGTDSLLRAELSNGVYYLGVSASGNENYNPAIANSGYGGKSQGDYELLLKFEPSVNTFDTLRDLDSPRFGVPGTAIDGDGDGTPGGVKNFWFETRPDQRRIEFTTTGAGVTPGQTVTVVGATGQTRTYEFVTSAALARPGNIAVLYNPGPVGATPTASLTDALRSAIRARVNETGVDATIDPTSSTSLILSGERNVSLSANAVGLNVIGRTIFVDKTASVTANGSLSAPFNNVNSTTVPSAFAASQPGDIVRIVGNGGFDNNPATVADNFSYQFGLSENGGATLSDGLFMQVPKGVVAMVDAGVALKFRSSAIIVGSSSLQTDYSAGALQVLGTPRLLNLTAPSQTVGTGITQVSANGNVVLTSTRDRAVDSASAGNSPAAAPGNWGGVIFRRDFDDAAGRANLEDQGIFLQSINHADIRFGGGSNILIGSQQQTVNPIQMIDLRPTITFNSLTNNASAAMSASPDSFEETRYQEPRFQQALPFTSDYDRIGPDIKNNRLTNNSINGLFLRTDNVNGQPPRQITVSARFDDVDIVHYIAENIVIAGRPGGTIQDGVQPDFSRVTAQPQSGASLAAGTYQYRMTFVDAAGFESLASSPTPSITTTGIGSSIRLVNLPLIPATTDYVSRRLYRMSGSGSFQLVAELDQTLTTFVDTGRSTPGSTLDLTRLGIRGRQSASLVVDPSTVVKLRGARIELGQGAQLLAEGLPGQEVIFTSYLDDRYGAGGSFDTNNDRSLPGGGASPTRGDWAGIYAGPTSNVSLDSAVVAYGGGISLLEGGQSRGFNPLELQQATARVANSRFEFNADGQGGSGPIGRNGRLATTPSTIFVRFSQPIIVGNEFLDNRGSIIDIDLDSLNDDFIGDLGRQTGLIGRISELDDNQGPLVRRNTTESVASDVASTRQLNGMRIRGGVLSSSSVWDDTDIAHVLFNSVDVGNYISGGDLTLKSRPAESLVVKLQGGGTPNSPTLGTGFTAGGSDSDIADRIGGTIHVLGVPGAPVILTSFKDDTVGAGRKLDGSAQTDTNGDSFGSRPEPNDWRSLYFSPLSNDRNVAVALELESPTANAPGLNSTVINAQFLGELAARDSASDDQFRLGLQVSGYLSGVSDQDVYSFTGVAGTEVFVDIDKTSFGLDSVVEVLDGLGNVLARSTNGLAEVLNPSLIQINGATLAGRVAPLADIDSPYTETWATGQYADYGSTNPKDAGLRFSLSGTAGVRSNYFVRIRSNGLNSDQAGGGLSSGAYTMQVRLREDQEFPGSVVQFADIRYANHGIHLQGLPSQSPLLGEAQEDEQNFDPTAILTGGFGSTSLSTIDWNGELTGGSSFVQPAVDPANPFLNNSRPLGARAQDLGNLVDSKTGTLSVGGELSSVNDVDFYRIDVNYDDSLAGLQRATVFDIDYADGFNRPDTNLSVFFSPTGDPQDASLVLFGSGSNIADDQASPTNDSFLGEILARGSVTANDPFIGPISLAQGSYFVAVTNGARLPQQFTDNPLLRREPIESLLRIFDDPVDGVSNSTAQPPVNATFVATSDPGWSQTLQRASDPGHQRTSTFNGTRFSAAFPQSIRFEQELNDTFATAMDLETGNFTFDFNSDIGSTVANTSQQIPHTSVNAFTQGEIVDIYSFEVPQDNSTVILDVDNGFSPTTIQNFSSVNLKMQLFQEVTDPVTLVTTRQLVTVLAPQTNPNSTALASFGAGGSVAGDGTGVFTLTSEDPFIQATLNTGKYFVAVSPELTTYDAATETFALDPPASRPVFGTYTLHVSIANHSFAGGDPANESFHFDRSAPEGSLISNTFDLSQYSAADLPRFYFDYFLDAAVDDVVTVVAYSNEQPAPVDLNANLLSPAFNVFWRQAILPLDQFAGDTGVTIEFQYVNGASATSAEGLYVDNFVVGFAERGEMVFGASPGEGGFNTPTAQGVAGKYQLESRPATQYIDYTGFGGVSLTDTFDTNERFSKQVSIAAPFVDQIADGDTFAIGDGSSTIRFEFTLGGRQPQLGNVAVPFALGNSQGQIARSIIESINSPAVQAVLQVKAATASGVWDFSVPGFTNAEGIINLHGNATGDFDVIASASDAPASGTPLNRTGSQIQLAAIYYDRVGDFNTARSQGQVIVDSNRVSDARAIGIWSEVGPRDGSVDDQVFLQQKLHLRQPPVGTSQLGAVLNLPTTNDSVIGGLAPGAVIVNNIVDQAGFSGIKVDGETRPVVIEWNGDTTIYSAGNTTLASRADILVPDGHIIAIDAGGTRVVFEFEDISGSPTNLGGSGTVGGDGFVDGHVPIYYRLGGGATYNPSLPAPIRNFGYSAHELMLAIVESINGSILVTNGLVQLVHATVGPSITNPIPPQNRFERDTTGFVQTFGINTPDFANPAVYLSGVTGIYSSVSFQKDNELSQLSIDLSFPPDGATPAVTNYLQAPVYDSVQPLAKIVNNTIYGNDGTDGSILVDGSLSPTIGKPSSAPDDIASEAIDTKLSVNHNGIYTANGVIGSETDVDFYKVELLAGDRLIVDVDTLDAVPASGQTPAIPEGPSTAIRVFDSQGIEVARTTRGAIAEYLKPGSTVQNQNDSDTPNSRDGFVDFTAIQSGTYYFAISSTGNENYDALNAVGRVPGTGGTGDYRIAVDLLAPKSFVFSLDSHPLSPFGIEEISGNINGTTVDGGAALPDGTGSAPSLVGSTFTISQIPDYLVPTRVGDAYRTVQPDGNRVTFEFTSGQNRIVLANGNINVPILDVGPGDVNENGYRVPDIMRAIANAINGYLNNPALPNHEFSNGPDGRSGPVQRVKAQALGGSYGDNLGIDTITTRESPAFPGFQTFPGPVAPGGGFDFTTGFGHDRRESGNQTSIVPDGTFTDARGTTELYVLIERAARIELSPEAIQAGLKLSPDHSKPQFATESDQLLTEFGVLLSAGASAAVLNNVVVNTHQSVVRDESSLFGFGGRIDTVNPDVNSKPGQVTLTGNTFEYDDERSTQIRDDLSWWAVPGINVVNTNPNLKTGLSTDLRTGPSNVRGGSADFNFVVRPAGTPGQSPGNFIVSTFGDILENAAGNRFTPVQNAPIVDSAVDTVQENSAIANLKRTLGIPSGLIVAPARDNSGQLRADDPFSSPPGGVGANVFKDRGALDRADFVGPVAVLEFPLDNDAAGIDSDPTTGFLRLNSGTYDEFRIRLSDLGDASDPFVGTGIDDNTVVSSAIDGLRAPGATVTIFENDRLLTEGIDYTFSYDTTNDTVTLRPLAGIWRDDRSYRIGLNNRNRSVLVAPTADQVLDGDQLSITDSNGGTVVFEFESGYTLRLPEALTLQVPIAGTEVGGLADGDTFVIRDATASNVPVIFEFDRDGTTLPGVVPITLPTGDTPIDVAARDLFLADIATRIAAAINAVPITQLDVRATAVGSQVVIGSEAGTVVDATRSGLTQVTRTLGISAPDAGTNIGGVTDGQTFTINDGNESLTFEIDLAGTPGVTAGNQAVALAANLSGVEVALAISRAIQQSSLRLTPVVTGTVVYLNLPLSGTASVSNGQLTLVGISRTPQDGDLLTFTPSTGGTPVSVEINRSDVDNLVTQGNARVDITRNTTADQLAALLATRLSTLPVTVAGLDPNAIRAVAGGQVAVGGSAGLKLDTSAGSSIEVVGTPAVTGPSTIQVFGPLLLSLPLIGGAGIADDSVLILKDDLGNDQIFLFNNATGLPSTDPRLLGASIVTYNIGDNSDVLADNIVTVINAANIGITAARAPGTGRISLGRIADDRVVTTGIPGNPNSIPPVLSIPGTTQITTRRGIVNDGEIFSIQQGATIVRFEFESVNGGGGVTGTNVPVPFQPGSTPGEVAVALAAAINNNRGSLQLSAVAERIDGALTGNVVLNDQPGTSVNISAAPTLNLVGVPGGSQAVVITAGSSADQIKQALIAAINGVNQPGQPPLTPLVATDRGGSTFFIENASEFVGRLPNYSLPAISDVAGNTLEPNRPDGTTQFTTLMPTVPLDFGDAADPVGQIQGRYPTTVDNDGPRHVISGNLSLGATVDADRDGQPSVGANGDNLTIAATRTGSLFTVTVVDGRAIIAINPSVAIPGFSFAGVDSNTPPTRNTISINTGVASATLEFDVDGIFLEENFAIRPVDRTSVQSIGEAIIRAIAESPLNPASVTIDAATGNVIVSGNDEDGVRFGTPVDATGTFVSGSVFNPNGVFNKGITTPISIGVRGEGVVEGWIDFNFDGDFSDPGEQLQFLQSDGSFSTSAFYTEKFDANGNLIVDTKTFNFTVPAVAPNVTVPTSTVARFRVSRDGGLLPTGLALSGEVEDYSVQLVPGAPPTIPTDRQSQSYTGREDTRLQAVSPQVGLLAGITDPNGDNVAIFAGDVKTSTLRTLDGAIAGVLQVNADGTFNFTPEPNFNTFVDGVDRPLTFTVGVTDVKPTNPGAQLVNSQRVTVSLTIEPVNDAPFATPPVSITRTVDEDEVLTLDAGVLFASYSPGPANESTQPLAVQSAGSAAGTFRSALGGTIRLDDDNRTIVYTPPANIGGVMDTFTYTVVDVPGPGQLSEVATTVATVTINLTSVNDPPTANPDNLSTLEDTPRTFTVNDLIGNDLAGPSDEVNASQTISLPLSQFPKTTSQGGQVQVQGTGLVYTPPALFSGTDTFTYTVVDNLGASSVGTVTVSVGAVNNAPRFVGINGDPTRDTLTFDESKLTVQRPTFNLSTWFTDPDGNALTFSVTSQNTSIVIPTITGGSQLELELPPFQFGVTSITVTASDTSGLQTTKVIPITVNNTPDAPSVVGSFDPLNAVQDEIILRDLGTVFNDPDREPLTYTVSRLGTIVNPTLAQIQASPLIESITFTGDQMRIDLDDGQFGSTDIEISATDGSFRVSTAFTLNVADVPDLPVAVADEYNVAIGSELRIINPAIGLLLNDSDADGDTIQVDVSSVIQPSFGTVVVNPNGTFVYTNTSGSNGGSDQFTYRITDGNGNFSQVVPVTLNFGASRYQNPLTNLASDVNADGRVTAIDALLIINLMNRTLSGNETSLPVNEIGTPPPDYVDVNGDGRVTTADALEVLTRLRQQDLLGSGQGEQLDNVAASSVSRTFASVATANLPTRLLETRPAETQDPTETLTPTRDRILAAGFDIESIATDIGIDSLSLGDRDRGEDESYDEALVSLFGEINLLGE